MNTVTCPKCAENGDEVSLQMDAETLVFLCPNKHSYNSIEVAEMTQAPKKGPKNVTKGSTKMSSDLVRVPEAELVSNMVEICKESVGISALSAEVEMLPNGDISVPILVREMYVEAVQQLAVENGILVTDWIQERIDFWMEQEFSSVALRK